VALRTCPCSDWLIARSGDLLRFHHLLRALRVAAPRSCALHTGRARFPTPTHSTIWFSELIVSCKHLTFTSQERQKPPTPPTPSALHKFWLDIAQGNERLGRDLIKALLRLRNGTTTFSLRTKLAG
jgi:hypothetical protein